MHSIQYQIESQLKDRLKGQLWDQQWYRSRNVLSQTRTILSDLLLKRIDSLISSQLEEDHATN